MINRLTQTINFLPVEQTTLNGMMPFSRTSWERRAAAVEQIKASIESQLREFQNGKCCYCGLKYDETGRGEIEHIAARKTTATRYPEFSFHPSNLAMSCQLCNSSSMKHTYDSIDNHNADYFQCTFRIVHPYLDNPVTHYAWSHGHLQVVITGITDKGRESIRLFELAGEHRTTARAKQRNQEILVALYNVPQNTVVRIRNILNFRR